MDFCEFHHTVAEIMQIKNMLYNNLKNIHSCDWWTLSDVLWHFFLCTDIQSHMKWEIIMVYYKILFEPHLPWGNVENHKYFRISVKHRVKIQTHNFATINWSAKHYTVIYISIGCSMWWKGFNGAWGAYMQNTSHKM